MGRNIIFKQDVNVHAGDISDSYRGIIICYYNNKPCGYIVNDGEWFYSNNINIEELNYEGVIASNGSLSNLMNNLNIRGICETFELIEFT